MRESGDRKRARNSLVESFIGAKFLKKFAVAVSPMSTISKAEENRYLLAIGRRVSLSNIGSGFDENSMNLKISRFNFSENASSMSNAFCRFLSLSVAQ